MQSFRILLSMKPAKIERPAPDTGHRWDLLVVSSALDVGLRTFDAFHRFRCKWFGKSVWLLVCLARSAVLDLSAAPTTNSAPIAAQKGAETPEKLISRISGYCLAGDSTNLLLCFD